MDVSPERRIQGLVSLDHIAGDIKRAYGMLVAEWVAYMEHLKEYYPYLFSLAVRVNPFNAEASAVVK